MIDENLSIPPAFFDEQLPQTSSQKATEQINQFIDKYKGILVAFVSIAMIALIIYLIANLQFIKTNPVIYCKNAGCYCLDKIIGQS